MRSYSGWNKRLAKRYDQWMIAMHYARETKSKYRKTIRIFIQFLADKSAARVTHWDIRRFIRLVSENGASLDATYRHLSVVRLFYDFPNLGGVVSYVAPRLVKLRRPLKNPGPMLTESQVRRLLGATHTLRERAVVELFYGTGYRLSEAIHLRVEDVDLVDEVAWVHGKFGKVRPCFSRGTLRRPFKRTLGIARRGSCSAGLAAPKGMCREARELPGGLMGRL